jgi:leucyl-tRNA synthetase
LFCLFAAPPEKDLEWSDQGVEGAYRFLTRVWRLVAENLDALKSAQRFNGSIDQLEGSIRALYRKIHQTIKRVTEDVRDRYHFNTAIAAIMELVNTIYQTKDAMTSSDNVDPNFWPVMRYAVESVIVMLSPFVPHIADELWHELGMSSLLLDNPWPSWDEKALTAEEVLIVVQVNGKLRDKITVSADATDEEIKKMALSREKVQQFITGGEIKNIVVVPKKLVNIVVKK